MSKSRNLKFKAAIALALFISLVLIAAYRTTSNKSVPPAIVAEGPGDQIHAEEVYAAEIAEKTGIFDTPDELFSRIGSVIRSASAAGKFQPDDFEKLDFSLPEDEGFGDNPQYEIYNQDGPFKLHPDSHQLNFYPKLARGLAKKLQPSFTLYRDNSKKELIADTLYGVVPDITKEICDRAQKQISLEGPPPTEPVQNGAIVPPANLTGMAYSSYICILDTRSKRYYLFESIASRVKSAGGKWQLKKKGG